MKSNYKAICTLKENSKEYVIYRNLDNNKFYRKIDGKFEELSLEDSKFYKGIERINDKIGHDNEIKIRKENVKKAVKFTGNAFVALLVVSLLFTGIHASYAENTPKREYKHSEKTSDDIMDLFMKSMEKNSTSNEKVKKEAQKYLQVFIDECNSLGIENDEVYIKIARQLRLMNFYDKEVLSYGDLCEIFDFRNGNFIAAQLYSYFENVSFNYRYNDVANLLYFNEDGKKALLSGENVKVEINGEMYNLKLNKIDKCDGEIFDLIEKYVAQTLEIEDSNSCTCQSNIFSSIMEKCYYASEVSIFYEIQEDGTILNVSYQEYYKRLANLIYTEGDEFDYGNQTDRELLYLYVEALRMNFGFQWEEEPTAFILDTFLSSDDLFLPVIGKGNFLRYLNGKPLDKSNLIELWDIAFMGEETLGCLQELNKCLKVEVSLGKISQEEYEYFVDMVVGIIEMKYPERLEEFKEANLYNKSMEGFELKLIPHEEI